MKPTAISINRKFNLGNYETLDVGLEATLTEQDNPLDAFRQLENMTELYLQNRLSKQPGFESRPASPQTAKEQPATKPVTIDSVKATFPEDLEAKLTFEDKTDSIILKPKQFLGSETFAKIGSVVRGLNGKYVSAGKDSHFRIPK